MKEGKYLKYNIGERKYSSHLDAVHAKNPKSDSFTGLIVTDVIKRINASGIIATISRTKMDINRPRNDKNAPAIDEYRSAIHEILEFKKMILPQNRLSKNYLHMAIHGMKDEYGTDFEIGTNNGDSCSSEVEKWFLNKLKNISTNIGVNKRFQGDQSKCYHRYGDPSTGYLGYGDYFHTIQIEICNRWRKYNRKTITTFLEDIITTFDMKFNT
jgi:N-formylglutamate amidohydrolase